MHSSGFILSLKNSSGNTLRETNYNQVYLPFNSEYKIYLKNNHNRKALASIKIDGKSIGEDIILRSYQSLDLERFILNGDLNSGKRFKFVPLSDSKVQDPTDSNNGFVEVKFTLEKEKSVIKGLFINSDFEIDNDFISTGTNKYKPICDIYYSNNMSSGSLKVDNPYIHVSNFVSFAPPTSDQGATIEGSNSNQSFVYGSIKELEDFSITLILQILGKIEYVTVTASHTVKNTKKKYCSNCSKILRYYDKFCSRCGYKQ